MMERPSVVYPPSAERQQRLQDGISRIQKVAAVEIVFRGAPGLRLFQKDRSLRFHSVWTPFGILFLRNSEIGKKKTVILGWASG